MPIFVDHAQRREELVQVAIDLIAEHGIDGASVRSIARAAGYSPVVVQHYFHNKAELLRMAFERTLELLNERIIKVQASSPDAQVALETFLPFHPLAIRTWRVWFAFWGFALTDDVHSQAQVQRGREGERIIEHILESRSAIPAAAAGGRAKQATRVMVTITGIASLASFDPEGWPADRQRQTLAATIASLLDT